MKCFNVMNHAGKSSEVTNLGQPVLIGNMLIVEIIETVQHITHYTIHIHVETWETSKSLFRQKKLKHFWQSAHIYIFPCLCVMVSQPFRPVISCLGSFVFRRKVFCFWMLLSGFNPWRKNISTAAMLVWDVGGYSKPLDEHKNKVWQLKYIENNHCCWSQAKHNTLLYFLLPRCYIVASKSGSLMLLLSFVPLSAWNV